MLSSYLLDVILQDLVGFWIENEGLFRWMVVIMLVLNVANGFANNLINWISRRQGPCKRMHYSRGYGQIPEPGSIERGEMADMGGAAGAWEEIDLGPSPEHVDGQASGTEQ